MARITRGANIFSQIIHGGRDVIEVALIAGALSTVIAVSFGTLAGFRGGWIDGVVTAITDIFLTIPGLPLLLVLASVIKLEEIWLLGVLLGLLGWPALLRAVRSQALSLKERATLSRPPARSIWARGTLSSAKSCPT